MSELVPQPQESAGSILAMISSAASDPNTDADKLERMFALWERMQQKDAETQFHQSMRDAQAEVSRIPANKRNAQTSSNYADYAQLDRLLRPIYTKNGFSLSFNSERISESEIMMLCYVSHRAGHTRTYTIPMPADGKGARGGDVMTKTHATGSATQYGMRYLLKMIFNVAVGNDDDGNGAAGVGLTDDDQKWIAKAKALTKAEEYQPLKVEVTRFYGSSSRIPADVTEALNAARKTVMPRD